MIKEGERCLAVIPKTGISVQAESAVLQSMPCDQSDVRQLWQVTVAGNLQ